MYKLAMVRVPVPIRYSQNRMGSQLEELVMNTRTRMRTHLLFCSLIAALQPVGGLAQPGVEGSRRDSQRAIEKRDGQHDFDFEIGSWTTRLSRLARPLTGDTTWVHYEGTSVVRKVWDGRANLVELDVAGPTGRIEGLSLRLYDPEARQWSLNFSNSRGGTLSPPVIGDFKNGRGEFYGQELLNRRAILVRFIISDITPTSARFEQAFSEDGGKTWEVNWIAIDTRVKDLDGRDDGAK